MEEARSIIEALRIILRCPSNEAEKDTYIQEPASNFPYVKVFARFTTEDLKQQLLFYRTQLGDEVLEITRRKRSLPTLIGVEEEIEAIYWMLTCFFDEPDEVQRSRSIQAKANENSSVRVYTTFNELELKQHLFLLQGQIRGEILQLAKKKRSEPDLVAVSTFMKPVPECTNTFNMVNNHRYVDIERVVDECVAIIREQLPLVTDMTHHRVPPLVLMRFARGGKTLTLARVFDKLKELRFVHPILISFNGSGPVAFSRREDETQTQAILRLIAIQLGDYTPEQIPYLVVDRRALDVHLGNDPVVVLMDELNNIGRLDNEAAQLLREMFLDRANRFLVFTTHFPISLEADVYRASQFLGAVEPNVPPSLRGIYTVNMSLANSLVELREMSKKCEALTEENAAWYGYIPSLIYSVFVTNARVTPSARFQQMNIIVDKGRELDILQSFVKELITGTRDPIVERYYGAFASVGLNSLVSYPLCYVKEILGQLNAVVMDEAVREILSILLKLEPHLGAKHSGLSWECTVEVAIILRMLHARWFRSKWFANHKFFNLDIPEGTTPNLAFRTLRDECTTIIEAKEIMESMIGDYDSPTLMFVVSANAQFPEVEGFMVYTHGHMASSKYVGFQMKTSDVKPRHEMNTAIINGGALLIRGRARAKHPRAAKPGWKYMTSEQVRDFLGNSLLLAMPREWLKDP